MKMLAFLLLASQFVYVLVLKLAAFMASALVILFASLFARELIRNSNRAFPSIWQDVSSSRLSAPTAPQSAAPPSPV